MTTTFDAVFSSWPAQPALAAALLLTAAIYLRGWRALRRRAPNSWHRSLPAAFIGGLIVIYLALASPIETFAPLLLQVHMLQHLLLMMVAPPLLWLGAPLFPLVRGLPREIRRYWAAPLLRWTPLVRLATVLTHPITAWIIFVAATWLWHLPPTYELALADPAWHYAQHVCFLLAGMIFWYPVVRPYPARPAWSTWLLVPYLILADVQNTILAALLTFSDQVLYPYYLSMPRLGGVSALDDQSIAGVIMWVPGSVVFLVPLAWIGVRLLQARSAECGVRRSIASRISQSPFGIRRFDLLRLPVLGSLLRWRYTRRIVQFAVLLVTLAVMFDGFRGPQAAPMNLAGVVPWIHWRGLVVIGLLAAGNVFCYGCPFMLPRTIARRWLPAARVWPTWLRTKWLAVALVAIFLWAYEAMALWNSPLLTAWIILAYFIGALVIDGTFRDAAFCKYVCPIGQFNFVQSIISPLEVKVREPAICTSCRTHDCIHGRIDPAAGACRGCELQLFQPRKTGNLDCTFCLDCVQACPHDNVGVLAVVPAKTLWRDGPRSGIGRLSRRLDFTTLALVLVFGAFANAAGMVSPVVEVLQQSSAALGLSSTLLTTTLFYGLVLFLLPAIAICAATTASRLLGLRKMSARQLACRFAWSLVPLGFAMWLAHYSFHFFTSFDTIVPVTQRFSADFGMASLGAPNWVCSCCRPAPDWLLKAELLMLDVGLLLSLYIAWRMALSLINSRLSAVKAAAPWATLLLALFAAGVWILLQPMQMRGTLGG